MSLDDELRAKQLAAGVDAAAVVLRRLVSNNADVMVRQITRDGLTLIAQEVIAAYVIETSRQAREHGSALIDGKLALA